MTHPMSIVSIAIGGIAGGLVGTAVSGNLEAQTVIAVIGFGLLCIGTAWWYTVSR